MIFPFRGNTERATEKKLSLSGCEFFSAVSQSAGGIITVCGFIVFFSVVLGFIMSLAALVSPALAGVVAGLLEFTKGSLFASGVSGRLGQALAGFCVGWSGLSVLCQTAAFTSPLGLSLKRYVAVKALQGVLCAFSAAFLIGDNFYSGSAISEDVFLTVPHTVHTSFICFILFAFSIKNLTKEYKI